MLMVSSWHIAAPSMALCHAVIWRGDLCARPLLRAVDALQGSAGACQPQRAAGLAQLRAQGRRVKAGGLADPCWRAFSGSPGEVTKPTWKAGSSCVLSLRSSLTSATV